MSANSLDVWSLGSPIGSFGAGTGDFATWSLRVPIGAVLPLTGTTYADVATGGLRGGGVATVSVLVAIAGAGGLRGGGLAVPTSTCVVLATGGLTAGGAAETAANGSASAAGSGGAACGGSAVVASLSVAYGTGGLTAGGGSASPSARSIVPRACRRVVVDLGLTRRQAEPTEALVQPSP